MLDNESTFARDVRAGLTSTPKKLSSKYFYDARGDQLFQDIMACPEYYLTGCETEIFTSQSAAIVNTVLRDNRTLDVIELGPGDASKSVHLLRALSNHISPVHYYPVDISSNILQMLERTVPEQVPGVEVHARCGDFVAMVHDVTQTSDRQKLVLFLGSTIGNLSHDESRSFLRDVRSSMRRNDMMLVGFDLQKDPRTILAAYNDAAGVTRDFNLNLLERMNRELGATFVTTQFDHYPMYDPQTGTCKSFLVSKTDQSVRLEALDLEVHFTQHECIHTEVSQKYTLDQIRQFGLAGGFESVNMFTDSKGWFVDALFFA